MEETKATARKVRNFIEANNHLFLEWRRGPGLGGMCGISSMILSGQLNQKSIPNEVIWGEFKYKNTSIPVDGHAWVRTKEYIVDITATQFGKRNRVYIVKVGNEQYVNEYLGDTEHGIVYDWGISKIDVKLMKKFMKKKDL